MFEVPLQFRAFKAAGYGLRDLGTDNLLQGATSKLIATFWGLLIFNLLQKCQCCHNNPRSSISKATNADQPKPIKDVVVVGGGIGGLSTALALSRISSLKVRVLEKSRSYSPTAGAGFGFSPNGRLCLVDMGIPKEEVQALVHPIKLIWLLFWGRPSRQYRGPSL